MIKQLIYSVRTLLKYRLYTGIALVGLSVSVTSVWFITDYVTKSYRYDTFHTNFENIYRLTMEITAGDHTDHYAATGSPPGDLMQRNYPGIKSHARLTFQESTVQKGTEFFDEKGFFKANPGTLDVFTFDLIRGDRRQALTEPNTLLLSKSMAQKYFDDEDALGKELMINETPYTVKGVFQDWPNNTHLEVQALLSSEQINEYEAQNWGDIEHYNYVLTDETIRSGDLDKKLDQLAKQEVDPILEGSGIKMRFHSQQLADLYFAPGLIDDTTKGSKVYINAMAIAGILVLLIAGLNFIKLNLTRSTQRSKEILLKRIMGISSRQLLIQNAVESLLMMTAVLMISVIFIACLESFYTAYTGFESFQITDSWPLIVILCLLVFVFGLIGTSYSGIYLSFSNNVVNTNQSKGNVLKNGLLAFQYAIATAILVITFSIEKQLDFIKNKDLGFAKENILMLDLPEDEDLNHKRVEYCKEIRKLPSIQHAALIGGGALPGTENGKEIFQVMVEGKKVDRVYNIYRIDEAYFELMDMKFSAGRNFKDNLKDRNGSVIINETLARSLNLNEPLGQTIWYGDKAMEIIGVVKNFHNQSLHNIIEPIVFEYETAWATQLLVKTQSEDLEMVKSTWATFFPKTPFSLSYFDQSLEAMYAKEDQLSGLFSFFSIVSLTLCAMGLFALFSLYVVQKTKEMSVRKILGAGPVNLLKAMVRDYWIVMALSVTIGFPMAWKFMDIWLSGFNYRVSFNPVVYLISAGIILLASLLIVGYHMIRTLHVNPSKTLKVE